MGIILMVLGGCGPVISPVKGFDYLSEQPISLAVSAIRIGILDGKKTPDNVELLMPLSLSSLVSQWVRERFLAMGRGPLMTFRVEEAWIRDLSFSSQQPRDAYQGKIRVTVSVGATQGGISVQSARPMPPGLSVVQRRQILQGLCEELIESLTKEADMLIPRILVQQKGKIPCLTEKSF